jgi:hypothetical protein
MENDALDAARYRWLRRGNAYAPEERCVTGGDALDALCDEGLRDDALEADRAMQLNAAREGHEYE